MDPVSGAVYGSICLFCPEYEKYHSTATSFDDLRVLWHSAVDNYNLLCNDFLYVETNH